MKTISTYLIIIFSLTIYSSFAQISKGTWLIDGGAALGTTLSPVSDNYNFFLVPSAGYFVSDRWMVGGVMSFGRSFNRTDFPFSGNSEFSINSYSFIPFLRYYFNKPDQLFHWFITAGGGINTQTSRTERIGSESKFSETYYNPFVGGGFNIFFHPNIALESTLQYQGLFSENDDTHILIYDIGLQLFLPSSLEDQSVTPVAIGKNAWILGLTANGGLFNISESNDLFFSLLPSAAYFLSDRFAFGSSLQIAFADLNALVNPEPFARYYFGKLQSTWQPFGTAGVGTRFQFADRASEASFFGLNAHAGLGLDIFVTPNVALEGILRYEAHQIEESSTTEMLRLEFGFAFFLGKNS